jgi:hypothetical protein
MNFPRGRPILDQAVKNPYFQAKLRDNALETTIFPLDGLQNGETAWRN